MGSKRVVMVAGVDPPTPELAEEWDKWYGEVHIPLLFKFPGILSVTRYRKAGVVTEPQSYWALQEHPTYLTVYEFESRESREAYERSPELAEARRESTERWGNTRTVVKWHEFYEPIQTWRR